MCSTASSNAILADQMQVFCPRCGREVPDAAEVLASGKRGLVCLACGFAWLVAAPLTEVGPDAAETDPLTVHPVAIPRGPRCGGTLRRLSGLSGVINRGLVCADCHFSWTEPEAAKGAWHRAEYPSFRQALRAGRASALATFLVLAMVAAVRGLLTYALYADNNQDFFARLTFVHLILPTAIGFLAGWRSAWAFLWVILGPCATAILATGAYYATPRSDWDSLFVMLAVIVVLAEAGAAGLGVALGNGIALRTRRRGDPGVPAR
jgi:hypothetical protein